ncbi:MAG: MarR family winged helix-turn-helix transcriptional regulator [Solirubrobacteraceae bacterium]
MEPSPDQYARLLELRARLRRFLHWSEEQAHDAGITPAQHQLMLAIHGFPGPEDPTVSDVAGVLFLRHNSVVGLVDRAQAVGLVERHRDPERHALVRLRLTLEGRRQLADLTLAHLDEVQRLAHDLEALWAAAGRSTPDVRSTPEVRSTADADTHTPAR